MFALRLTLVALFLVPIMNVGCKKEEKVIMPTATLQAPPPDADRSSGGSRKNDGVDK